jgi:hypothetical protein
MGIGLGIGINRSNYAQGIFGAYQSRVIADGGVTEAGGCVDAVSSLLQSASLLLIPSGYKGGKAYAQIPTNGNGDLTWTRASDANRTNSSGNIELMASGVPRLSYMHGSCPALLLEPQRTNLALQSESFDNASWVKSNSTVTANSTTSPDGTTNADTLITTNSLNFHRLSQNTTISALTNYTYTIFAKQNSSSLIQIALNTGFTSTPSLSPYANFNLSTGVVSQSGNGATASIQSVGNGWYRCVITATSLIGISAGQINIVQINSTTAPPFQSWQGTGEESVFIYGSQVEAGAYPTTYIPTTTASATRVADSFSRNNIFTNGLITSSGGTWFMELRGNVAYTRDAFGAGIYISDTTNLTSNNINIRNGGGGAVRLAINKVISGVSTALYLTTTDTVKLAIKWNGTTADIFANGTKVISATSFTPTNMEFLNGIGADVPKFIQQMALYPSPLSDTDCTTLTTL